MGADWKVTRQFLSDYWRHSIVSCFLYTQCHSIQFNWIFQHAVPTWAQIERLSPIKKKILIIIYLLDYSRHEWIILRWLTHFSLVNAGLCLCYFPTEYQGEWMTQASSRGGINLQYAPITILGESIPVWGVCHRRIGKRVILMDR